MEYSQWKDELDQLTDPPEKADREMMDNDDQLFAAQRNLLLMSLGDKRVEVTNATTIASASYLGSAAQMRPLIDW
uniref:Phage protein n=1 Tax=Steinernema glaseri TaxID=37863 RepID=A0A1I7ZN89_9BILA